MLSRYDKWWPLWMMLVVIWTMVALTFGWLNLPRAQHLPQDPQLLGKLSNESSSILRGSYADAKSARGVLIWSEKPQIVRMWNDTPLQFPATTTNERIAFVASEYHQLLEIEADNQRGPYLLIVLAIWLAPIALLLAAGPVGNWISGKQSFNAYYVGQRTERRSCEDDNQTNDRAPAHTAAL